MILAHKIRLEPNNRQKGYLTQAAGTARFVWNWALAEWDQQFKDGKKPNAIDLKKQFNQIKYEEFPWLKGIHRDAHSQPFADLKSAFQSFFKKTSKRPKFKKRGRRDAFYLANDVFRLDGDRVRLPKIGWINLSEKLRFQGKIMSARVSRQADQWFISIQVDVGDYQKPRAADGTVGVDLGIKTFAVTSSDQEFQSPKPLSKFLKKLKRLQRRLSKRIRGSNRFKKLTLQITRLHARISNIRKDALNKITTQLCRENQAIAIEDLNVSGMVKNRKLSRAISDLGFYEFRRQIEYKSRIFGTDLVVIDRWFPSSKTCSGCGEIKKTLTLSQRSFCCEGCGLEIDRDLNAAKNLHRAGFAQLQARGPEGSGHRWETKVKPRRAETRIIQDSVKDP